MLQNKSNYEIPVDSFESDESCNLGVCLCSQSLSCMKYLSWGEGHLENLNRLEAVIGGLAECYKVGFRWRIFKPKIFEKDINIDPIYNQIIKKIGKDNELIDEDKLKKNLSCLII